VPAGKKLKWRRSMLQVFFMWQILDYKTGSIIVMILHQVQLQFFF